MKRHSDSLEQSGSGVGQVIKQLRCSYDNDLKIMVIIAAETFTNNQAVRKGDVEEFKDVQG